MMEDKEIRLALGIDPEGKCLRHPNVQVVTVDSSENDVACHSCKVCRLELAGGGLKLRGKSELSSTKAVQDLKQNRKDSDDIDDEHFQENLKEQDDSDIIGTTDTEAARDVVGDTSYPQRTDKDSNGGESTLPSNLKDVVRNALLRGSQVQKWLLIEKTKEIETLKKQLEDMTIENESLKKQMESQRASFEETIKKQEKTINQELKMIKSIASQRAVSRATKSSQSSEGEAGFQQSHSSFLQSSAASLSISAASSHEAPPQIPIRQASEKEGAERSPASIEKMLSITSGPKDPPKIPIRQTSNQLKTMTKDAIKAKVSPRSVQRKISESSHPPSCPQRQASEEVYFDSPVDHNSVSQNSADAKINGILNSIQSQEHEVTDATPIIPNGSTPVNQGSNSPDRDTLRRAEYNNETAGSQEISFVPTDSERIVRTTSITEAAGSLKSDSNEIEFDASFAFHRSKDLVRKISATMNLDAKQQLLLEASQALSLPTPSQRHRKTTSSKESTDGSSETPIEINFGRSGITHNDRQLPEDVLENVEKEKSDEQILQEKIFGKAAVASEEDEEDDEYDFFGIPSELPVNSDRYLDCTRDSMNLSPVSALTSTSYLFDAGLNAEEEIIEPKKGLQNTPFAKRLPMEENFDSDDDTKPDKPDKDIIVPNKKTPMKSAFHKPTPRGATKSKKVMRVENQVVHDKYGDGGMYSGYISTKERLPHGKGKMIYDNGREYEGDWKGGRWHGFGRWKNPNGDYYEGKFVYDARHGLGVYRWRNGNEYKGDFHEDKRQGKGIFNFANGNVYEGDFVNGIFEGKGRYKFEGGFYEGDWASGRYHGKGFLSFVDGSSYCGAFENGIANGEGEETAADGTITVGIWENGRQTT